MRLSISLARHFTSRKTTFVARRRNRTRSEVVNLRRTRSVARLVNRLADKANPVQRYRCLHAQVVLGILTPDTKESSYVLMELGASWGQKKRCFPLLAKGAKRADIASPISDLHFLQLADGKQCHQLIDDLHYVAKFKRRKGVGAQIEEKVTKLVQRAGVARGCSTAR